MESSRANWEKRELADVLPKIPTDSLCAFCGEVMERSADDDTPTFVYKKRHKRRRLCFPPGLHQPASYVEYSKRGTPSSSRQSTSELARIVDKHAAENSPSSSSLSSLSLYTSDSSEEDADKDDRLSCSPSPTSQRSVLLDRPTEPVGLPADYLSKHASLQDWLAKRKSFRHAMDWKADVTRWLQNKTPRTPLEERVLALSKQTGSDRTNGVQMGAVRRCKSSDTKGEYSAGVLGRSRSGATTYEQSDGVSGKLTRSVATDLSQDRTVPPTVSISCESASASVVDAYLKQRRLRLLDLFRCVDVSRSGRCSRRDFCYVLQQAEVPLTRTQAERLADSLAADDRPNCVEYWRLAPATNRRSEMRMFRKRRAADAETDSQSSVSLDVSQWSSSLLSGVGSDAAQSVCPEVTETETLPDEDRKRTYCRRVLKLIRENALIGDSEAKKPSSSQRRDYIAVPYVY